MKHALPEAVVRYPWPSTQRASQMIVERAGESIRLLQLRERLAEQFERIGRAA